MKLTFLSLFLIVYAGSLSAQTIIPFGKPSKKELTAQYYPDDSSAVAAYLHDECKTRISYYTDINGQGGFRADLSTKLRLKIYTKEGLKYLDNSISLYINKHLDIDKLTNFRVITYNWVDGKIQKSILPQSAIKIDKQYEGVHILNYTPLDVKVGSVVDIQYTIQSPHIFDIPSWNVQADIPTKWFFYQLSHPDFIDYQVTKKGYIELTTKQNNTLSNFNYNGGSNDYQYTELEKNYTASDIPAFKVEPFLSSSNNYRGALEFDIIGHNVPGGLSFKRAYTWDNVCQTLLGSNNLGGQLEDVYFIDKDVHNLVEGLEEEQKIALTLLKHIQNRIQWNGFANFYCNNALKDIYEDKIGNSAEVNLLLVMALKSAGLKAFPVLLNTRNKGVVNPIKPSLHSFNYLIAGFEQKDGSIHLLDATDPLSTLDLLPKRCLNGQGLRLGSYASWVNLNPSKKDLESYISELTLDEEGLVQGTLKYVAKDYAAYYLRQKWLKEESVKGFVRQLDREQKYFKIGPGKVQNMDKNELPLNMNFEISLQKSCSSTNNRLVLNPIFMGRIEKNPFQASSRKYPIEFMTLAKKSFVMTIHIPENYTLESLPTPEIIKLPHKSGQFSYNATALGQKIQLVYSYKLNETTFFSDDYAHLQNFYDAIIRKQAESIILKKKS
ncbi:hypothetical protein [Aureispira anguillae]|uniref:DUF3857 domain-containing protein n=1 Tax=Aureispira anguillae TaxID=2864201 RepID=A0A916DSP1_9BACT|nr:hypothetical protein [Aureispira anguillae]BDS12654.1 hypothetical protein AsAng_0033780 [Aureispira anguillae]